MYCSTCGDERLFEQPPCEDGHGAECPERICTECGTAMLIGLPVASPATLEHAGANDASSPAERAA
ncbi:hypothetical protein [Actinomadura rudentiformis]|uniref:Uncharacterized protein n=1 Tax=Actinomadura rudentiformis TaxID=359158 RepID=A0A6H9Z729_9ACTN|nr:hypothetical protein [Actinomadura rudentiformis]KAB2349605.1 hypothetical protein F8566_12645 [Actinomadura rudentiformis]